MDLGLKCWRIVAAGYAYPLTCTERSSRYLAAASRLINKDWRLLRIGCNSQGSWISANVDGSSCWWYSAWKGWARNVICSQPVANSSWSAQIKAIKSTESKGRSLRVIALFRLLLHFYTTMWWLLKACKPLIYTVRLILRNKEASGMTKHQLASLLLLPLQVTEHFLAPLHQSTICLIH